MIDWSQVYAKSDGFTTLEMHTRHVITAGLNLIEKLPFNESEKLHWKEKLFRVAILHDLGKLHPDFQKRLNGDRNVNIRHEIISLWFCENFLDLPKDELFAIATHHKGVISNHGYKRLEKEALREYMEYHYSNSNNLLCEEVIRSWLKLFDINLEFKSSIVSKTISKEMTKMLGVTNQMDAINDPLKSQEFSFMRALLIAADHIGSARKEEMIPNYVPLDIKKLNSTKRGETFAFRDFQKRLQTINSDVILHAPTGSGKTEAALSWVHANQSHNSRLYYLLPYTASINAMVGRLQEVYSVESVTALHSKTLDFFYAQLTDEASNLDKTAIENAQEARSKKSLSSELFYPVKVATLHQVLKTSLKGKGWEFALYDYKNALFIIDEFHTYNALLTGLLLASIKLFKRLFDAKFLFMSATIPEFMLEFIIDEVFDGNKNKLIRPNPESQSDSIILNRKRHILCCKKNQTLDGEIKEILDFLNNGKSVLVIVNNVKTAQYLFGIIDYDDNRSMLLHSGFHKKSRNIIEQAITNKDKNLRPQLLIATQAVEVSLDIDYDMAFIEKAPIDALIQRFGRVNRAGSKKPSPVFLFEEIIGNTPFYDDEVLEKTWNNLIELDGQTLSEVDLIVVCNKVYEHGYNEKQLEDFNKGLLENPIINNYENEWIAGDWRDWVEDAIENSNQKIDILCSNLKEDFYKHVENKEFIEANQLLVSVYFYEAKDKYPDKDRGLWIVNNLYYDEKIGYITKPETFDDLCL
ncbi:CRISPR-associated helicase, Cas3 family [Spirosomataceae bacterium TFI 002]|nr:CRISPR-associated helicase, Cas3 family [Spirosomataceae bacterium TFI 002]